jgi:hypothetical protein
MGANGSTLVEELGTVSRNPNSISLTEIPSFRFFAWSNPPGPSFVSHDFRAYNVQLWRIRTYKLGEKTFEEDSYHPFLSGWEKTIRGIKRVPDGYAYERMLEALALLNGDRTGITNGANEEATTSLEREVTQTQRGGDQRASEIKQLWANEDNLKGFARLAKKLQPTWRMIKSNVDSIRILQSQELAEEWVSNMWENRDEVRIFASRYPAFTRELLSRAVDKTLKKVNREPVTLACYHAALEFKANVNGERLSIVDVYLKYDKDKQLPAPTTLRTYYSVGLSLLEQSE